MDRQTEDACSSQCDVMNAFFPIHNELRCRSADTAVPPYKPSLHIILQYSTTDDDAQGRDKECRSRRQLGVLYLVPFS